MRWMVSSDEPVGAWAVAGLQGGTEYQNTLGSAMVKDVTLPSLTSWTHSGAQSTVVGAAGPRPTGRRVGEAGGAGEGPWTVEFVGLAPALPRDTSNQTIQSNRLKPAFRRMLSLLSTLPLATIAPPRGQDTRIETTTRGSRMSVIVSAIC